MSAVASTTSAIRKSQNFVAAVAAPEFKSFQTQVRMLQFGNAPLAEQSRSQHRLPVHITLAGRSSHAPSLPVPTRVFWYSDTLSHQDSGQQSSAPPSPLVSVHPQLSSV